MRRLLPVLALLLLGACGTTTVIPRPPEGYAALRFSNTVAVPMGLAVAEFPAGTTLVADRLRDSDGEKVFCGPWVIRDWLATQTGRNCFLRRGDALLPGADRLDQPGTAIPVPPGSIEEIRLR